MEQLYSLSLLLYFIGFAVLAGVVEAASLKRRLAAVRTAASRVPAGMTALGARFVSPTLALGLKRRLLEAGQPRDLDVDGFISLKVLSAVVGSAFSLVVGVLGGFIITNALALFLICAGMGWFAPDVWLARLIRARKARIQKSLPDVLDMLTISVEAGLGFDSALNKVVQNYRGPLSLEFWRWLQEVKLGRSRKEAWRDFADRIGLPEVNSFVQAILQADVFGISIGKILRVQSEEMRVKRRQRAEEIAMKAPVKVVFPLVLCIFPALLIVVLGPAGIRIVQNFNF